MALTRSFTDLVQKQAAEDPVFAERLIREGIDCMLAGDVDAGKAIARGLAGNRVVQSDPGKSGP